MCELMGMCFANRISANFSIREFACRGEENADGWGLAWYPDQAVKIIKEPIRWKASQFDDFLEQYNGLDSSLYIAHVRHKTTGGTPTHSDTHPFERELGGLAYCFAHNGTLSGDFWKLPMNRFVPVGRTDSEFLFCFLLNELAREKPDLERESGWQTLFHLLSNLNRFGKLNCLLSDGRRLFCYHDANGWKGLNFRATRIWDNHSPQFEDATIKVELADPFINFGVVVATAPLSANGWHPFLPGELLVLEGGQVRYSSHRAADSLLVTESGQPQANTRTLRVPAEVIAEQRVIDPSE